MRLLKQEGAKLYFVDKTGTPPTWVQQGYDQFRLMLCASEKPFPCFFGVAAEEDGALRYTYVEDDEVSRPVDLPYTLHEYLRTYRSISGRSAFVVFVGKGNKEAGPEDYETDFWNIIQYLHDNDPSAWPEDMPKDPHNPSWEFCFGGEPIFITGHSPSHIKRKSRHSRSGLLLIIQTRANLQGIVGHGRTAETVRKQIRSAVEDYDSMEPSPDLGVFGEPDTFEWKQYWLLDTNEISKRTCPLKISPHEPEQNK